MHILNAVKKSFLSFGKSVIIVLILIAPLVSLEAFYPGAIAHLNTIIAQHRLGCTLFRWIILLAGFSVLTLIFRHWAKVRRWSIEEKAYRFKQRLHILLWAVLFEIIVCENIFSVVMHFGKS
jgi:hypothetical protein